MNIIEKLQAATGPDRELDAEIAVWAGKLGWQNCYGEPGYEAKHFTTSIDAALTLLPEGWMVTDMSELGGAGGCLCSLGNPGTGEAVTADAGERTLALAVCSAALRARGIEQ